MGKIKITKLGPLKNYEFEIKQINLLIGEQATGKSTICKAIYFFRLIKNEVTEYLFRISINGKPQGGDVFPKVLNSTIKEIFVQLFGLSWNLPDDLCVEYFYTDDKWVKVDIAKAHGKKYLSVNYSEELTKEIKEIEKKSFEFYKNQTSELAFTFISSERVQLHNEIQNEINIIFNDVLDTYYIPAGRSLLTLLAHQKTKLDYSALDLVDKNFMQFIENIQPKFDRGISMVHNYYVKPERKFDVNSMIREIQGGLKGDYYYNEGQEFFVVDEENRIPINFISSGQQEVLWLLNQLYVLLLRDEKAFVVIEEPEAHLYPKLQKRVVDFIVKFANITKSTVIITSHSPYVLTAMNTLCYAGKLTEEGKREKVEKIIGKYNAITVGSIYAGKLVHDNDATKVQNMIIDDNQELYTELIDEISDINNQIYTRLYELEEQA